MARGLVHLQKLEIEDCLMMKEVVAKEGDEEEQDQETILFPQLNHLQLKNLPKLRSFCHVTFALEWPLLENVAVYDCPALKTFSFGSLSTSKLKGVDLKDPIWRWMPAELVWMGNLNDTIRHLYKEKVIKLTNLEDRVLQMDSLTSQLQDNSFHVILEVIDCDNLLNVFPSHLIQRMQNLKRLEVRSCNSLEVVFDFEGLNIEEVRAVVILDHLENLKVKYLPELTHIWKKYPRAIRGFENIKSIEVSWCGSLKYLFSLSIVKLLVKLEEVKISYCEVLEEVVANNGGEDKVAGDILVLPGVRHLLLEALPNLTSFCPKMKTIASSTQNLYTVNSRIEETQHHHLFSKQVAFPSLMKLEIWGLSNINEIWCSQLPKDQQGALFINMVSLSVFSCETLRNIFSPSMARGLVHLQELEIGYCLMMEEVVAKEGDVEEQDQETILFPQLNHLRLQKLPKLMTFCHVTCALELPLLENVAVCDCPALKTFSLGSLSTSKLRGVAKWWWMPAELVWMGNLNDTIRHLYKEKVTEKLLWELFVQAGPVGIPKMKRKQRAKKGKSPILKKIKNDTDGLSSSSKKDAPKANKSVIIKKPPTSYIRFMTEYIAKEKEKNPSSVFSIKNVNEMASKAWKTMSESERAKYIAQTQNEMTIYKSQCPPKPPKKNDVAVLQTRSQLHEFVDLVKGFDQAKKKAVQQIGFGGLLLLKCSILRRNLCTYLVNKFNTSFHRMELEDGKYITITDNDVACTLGIPIGGTEVVVKNRSDSKPLSWQQLKSKLINIGDIDEFKRDFVLFAYATVLCPSASAELSTKVVPLLVDVSKIHEYNWANHVLQYLVNNIKLVQEKKRTYICGSLLFLMMFYLSRTSIGRSYVRLDDPPLSAWTDELISKRLMVEEKDIGGFGRGEVVKNKTAIEVRHWDSGASSQMPPETTDTDHTSTADLCKSILERHRLIETLMATQSAEIATLVSMLNKKSQDEESGPSFPEDGNAFTDDTPHVPREATPKKLIVRLPVRRAKLGAQTKSPFELEPGERRRNISSLEKIVTNYVWSKDCLPSDTVVEMCRMFLEQRDIKTLYSTNWVNDSVIDMYARLVNVDDQGPIKRHIFDSSFSVRIKSFQSKKIIKEDVLNEFSSHYMPKIIGRDLAECSLFFVPVCWGDSHWIALVVNTTNHSVEYLDSMNSRIIPGVSNFNKTMCVVLEMILTEIHQESFPLSKYSLQRADVPKQRGPDNCGIYVMKFMRLWNGRMEMSLYPGEGDRYRIDVAAEIILHANNTRKDEVLKKALLHHHADIDDPIGNEKEKK